MEYRLSKVINVNDPYNWYYNDTITVEMFRMVDENDYNKLGNTVRIIFKSVDDFMVYRDFSEWDFDTNWNWCKNWLWDKIPNVVNCVWMYEHGYCAF